MHVLREKHLLKEAMRARLPASITARHKQPYRAPDAAAFLAPGAPAYVTELMGRKALADYGYFDPDKVGRLVAQAAAREGARGARQYGLRRNSLHPAVARRIRGGPGA